MYGQRFLFGAWTDGRVVPDYLVWAGTKEEAAANVGLLTKGRRVSVVQYGDLEGWDMVDGMVFADSTDPVTNCLCLKIQDRIVRFLA